MAGGAGHYSQSDRDYYAHDDWDDRWDGEGKSYRQVLQAIMPYPISTPIGALH